MFVTDFDWLVALAFGCSFALSLMLPYAVRPLLARLGVMDVPNARSSHERPVLRGLGLAVLIAMAVGGGFATWIMSVLEPDGSAWRYLLIVTAGSLAAAALGLREDLKGLSVGVRSAFLLLISLSTSAALIWLATRFGSFVMLDWGIAWEVSRVPWWGVTLLALYGVLFIAGYINVANFMDGLNGISGFHGVIAGVAFATVGWLAVTPWLVLAGVILAAGFAGFLPWNLSRPGGFLGDVGSYLLGGATAIISLGAFLDGVPLLATIGPLAIYFGDVVVTLVRRVRAGQKFSEPHKEHAYQRIQQLGYSHVQASAMVAACTALVSALGIFSLFTTLIGTLMLAIAGIAVLVFYLMLPRLLPVRAQT